MFHRVKTESQTPSQASAVKAPEASSSYTKQSSVASTNQNFVKSQTSSGKTPSYLQPTKVKTTVQDVATTDVIKNHSTDFSATEERAVKITPTPSTTKLTQQTEKDTDIMPENSSIVSQTSSYHTPEKTESASQAASLYSAETKTAPSSSGYAPSYSSPYAKQSVTTPAADAYAAGSDSKLTIGRGITMSGEIESCDHLYVEGTVEAALKGAQVLDIAESGIFYGTVEIENANISGRFEGEITVKGRLVVESTGVITGSITYGELQIESGAIIDGRLTPMASATPAAKAVDTTEAKPAPVAAAAPKAKAQAPVQQEQAAAAPQSKGLFEKQSVVPAE